MTEPRSPARGATFDLLALASELRAEPAYEREGQSAKTLIRTDDLRVVLVALAPGKTITEHHARVTASVHTLSGRVRLNLPDGPVEVPSGKLLVMAAGLDHDVHALEESAFLLTLGWSVKG